MDRKKAGVAILISDKIDFKKTAIKRDPDGHFIMLKGRIHQEEINIVNIDALNIGAPKYIKKILEDFKKDIDSNTIIVRYFNTPLSKMDRSSKENINKDIVALYKALDEMDLTDIYRAFHPKEAKYTFFPMTLHVLPLFFTSAPLGIISTLRNCLSPQFHALSGIISPLRFSTRSILCMDYLTPLSSGLLSGLSYFISCP